MIYDKYREQLDKLRFSSDYPKKPQAPKSLDALSREQADAYFNARDAFEIEQAIYDAASQAVQKKRDAIHNQMEKEWVEEYLGEEYAYLNSVISYPAYEAGHAYGHSEIESKYANLAEIAIAAVKASKEQG